MSATQQQKYAVIYYIIRSGSGANAIIAIHRVYDSAVACFQMLMDAGLESINMYGVGTNERGLSIVEWVIHSYTKASATEPSVLQQHGVASIHREDRIPALRAPTTTLDPASDTSVPAIQPGSS